MVLLRILNLMYEKRSLDANVPLVGDGWDRKSQLFEPKTIITSTN